MLCIIKEFNLWFIVTEDLIYVFYEMTAMRIEGVIESDL